MNEGLTMYRVFYTHKKLGRYCIRTYQDTPLSSVISETSAELSKPKYHGTSCEILNDLDEVLWNYEPIKKKTADSCMKRFTASFEKKEYEWIMEVLKNHNMSSSDFIRASIKKLEENT